MVQDQLGIELMLLVEDPQAATIEAIVLEAHAQLAALHCRTPTSGGPAHVVSTSDDRRATQAVSVHVSAYDQSLHAGLISPSWVSPAPFSIKMRVFCFPYAGGVSDNVFAK